MRANWLKQNKTVHFNQNYKSSGRLQCECLVFCLQISVFSTVNIETAQDEYTPICWLWRSCSFRSIEFPKRKRAFELCMSNRTKSQQIFIIFDLIYSLRVTVFLSLFIGCSEKSNCFDCVTDQRYTKQLKFTFLTRSLFCTRLIFIRLLWNIRQSMCALWISERNKRENVLPAVCTAHTHTAVGKSRNGEKKKKTNTPSFAHKSKANHCNRQQAMEKKLSGRQYINSVSWRILLDLGTSETWKNAVCSFRLSVVRVFFSRSTKEPKILTLHKLFNW